MIYTKTAEEIAKMRQGGKILAGIMEKIKKEVRPGITTLELDQFGDKLISQVGEPSFKHVRDYKWATCLCVNEVVVHGIPNDYKLKDGDLLGIDIGMLYKGFNTDMAKTIKIESKKLPARNAPATTSQMLAGAGGKVKNDNIDKFLDVGREALKRATEQAQAGNRVGHISQAIQQTIERAHFSVVPSLVGHGVGKVLHEPPQIPGVLREPIEQTPLLEEGMVIAIEVIYNQGKPQVVYRNNDGWTIQTADGSLSGLFENTIAILKNGPEILTITT